MTFMKMNLTSKICNNSLTAEDLLENRGINKVSWQECEKYIKILPKTGKKQFQPNNSLLQKLQIDRAVNTRKDILSIERVERYSQLVVAEWLPDKKLARVDKRSGQDWSVYGIERDGELFLYPEETLLLIEMNSLQLMWNNIPVSLQQAYEILIDDLECTLEEYRVYSQLSRCGYRVQRFIYNEDRRYNKIEEHSISKRKVIVDPENGLRLSVTIQNKQKLSDNKEKVENVKSTDETLQEDVKIIVNAMINEIESNDNCFSKDKKRNAKISIVGDETLLDDIKIVRPSPDTPSNPMSQSLPTTSKGLGNRIQRNVKWLPKRTDKELSNFSLKNAETRKRKISDATSPVKKFKNVVIELSDDEIEEVGQSLTKMEMLNMLPNIAEAPVVVKYLSEKYLPPNVKILKIRTFEKKNGNKDENRLTTKNIPQTSSVMLSNTIIQENSTDLGNQISHDSNNPIASMAYETRQIMQTSNNSAFCSNNKITYNFNQNTYLYNKNNFFPNMSNNMFNFLTHLNIQGVMDSCKYFPLQMNNLFNSFLIKDSVNRHNARDLTIQLQAHRNNSQNYLNGNLNSRNMSSDQSSYDNNISNQSSLDGYEMKNKSTFTKYTDVSSWSELKQKWREERTIVIDDEESIKDNNEVEVLECVNPLVNNTNVNNFSDVYKRLNIIKSASGRIMRRKNIQFKISFNVYANIKNFRKTNPGIPMFCLVITRRKDKLIPQPADLCRLQQDAKSVPIVLANVSTSISYIQPGFVVLPNVVE